MPMPKPPLTLTLLSGCLLSACVTMDSPDGLRIHSAQVIDKRLVITGISPVDLYEKHRPNNVTSKAYFCKDGPPGDDGVYISSLLDDEKKDRLRQLFAEDKKAHPKQQVVPVQDIDREWQQRFNRPENDGTWRFIVDLSTTPQRVQWRGSKIVSLGDYDLKQNPQDICFYLESGLYLKLGYRSNVVTLTADMAARTLANNGQETFPVP